MTDTISSFREKAIQEIQNEIDRLEEEKQSPWKVHSDRKSAKILVLTRMQEKIKDTPTMPVHEIISTIRNSEKYSIVDAGIFTSDTKNALDRISSDSKKIEVTENRNLLKI